MRPNPLKTILGGFVGTVVMTLMMYFVAPMMLGRPMDIAAMLGGVLGGSWAMGMLMHLINGSLIFPLIFAYLLYRVLPGEPWLKGTILGLVLWFLSQTIVTPMMGGGMFSARAGGMMAVVASFIGHVVYGALLGAVASAPEGPLHEPTSPRDAPIRGEPARAGRLDSSYPSGARRDSWPAPRTVDGRRPGADRDAPASLWR